MSLRRLVLLLLLSSLPVDALADDGPSPRANQLSGQALELAKKKDFTGALKLYEEALEMDPGPQRQCNVGAAYFQLDRWAQAHFFLGLCLSHTGTLSASLVEQMSKAFAYADRKLQQGDFAQVHFKSVPTGALVDVPSLARSARFVTPRTVWLPRGQHSFIASSDTFEKQVGTFEVASQDPQAQTIEFQVPRVTKSPQPVGGEPRPEPASPEQYSEPTSAPLATVSQTASEPPSPSRTTAIAALVVGSASLAIGGAFHFKAVGIRSDLETMPSGAERSALVEDLKTDRLIMAGLYGSAALAFGLGAYLWLAVDAQDSALPSASVSKGQASMALTWIY